jgi:hypothetical protein
MQEQQPTFLERLQGLSRAAKSRIVFSVATLALIGLGALWANDVKNNLIGIDKNSFLPANGTVLSATNYVTIESYEERGDKRYIYFKVQNNTSKILNFSKQEKVNLEIDHQTIAPDTITDRQQSVFANKILSNSVIYGTLIFSEFEGSKGTIVFDEMFFEDEPNSLFRESIEVDFKKLKPVEELRS